MHYDLIFKLAFVVINKMDFIINPTDHIDTALLVELFHIMEKSYQFLTKYFKLNIHVSNVPSQKPLLFLRGFLNSVSSCLNEFEDQTVLIHEAKMYQYKFFDLIIDLSVNKFNENNNFKNDEYICECLDIINDVSIYL